MASLLVEGWIYATVPIDNPQGESGTGFLVRRPTGDDKSRILLITNKHVVHDDDALRSSVTHVKCHFNIKKSDGSNGVANVDIQLEYPSGAKRYREHPDGDTDVLVIDVTDLMVQFPQIIKKFLVYDEIPNKAKRDELDITAGEDVVTIGYPLGMRQGDSNFPVLRQGMIATHIGEKFIDQVLDANGNPRQRSMQAFLFDGGAVPGSSGSPVVLKPVVGRLVKGQLVHKLSMPVLLGIVAETTYAPIQSGGNQLQGFAGMGLAFDTDTIIDTINLF